MSIGILYFLTFVYELCTLEIFHICLLPFSSLYCQVLLAKCANSVQLGMWICEERKRKNKKSKIDQRIYRFILFWGFILKFDELYNQQFSHLLVSLWKIVFVLWCRTFVDLFTITWKLFQFPLLHYFTEIVIIGLL